MTQSPDLPPEQEAVRRLLADARHDGPTPPEVVARLDATLASLAAERGPGPTPETTSAPVVDLGARRRRAAGIGLLAAAAVVVAGVALGQGLPSGEDSSSAGSAADSDMSTSQRESGDDGSSGADSEELGPQSLKSGTSAPLAAYPTLSTDDGDLDGELLSLRDTAAGVQAPGAEMSTERLADCDLSGAGRGRRVLAQVDGVLGAVVFRRADGTSQQVDLYVCGDPTAVRTLTLPAP
ncbi:hypothetical protein [Nocardioides baculatus]|uniref:Uncharacterized protein n=1 Tax=Nocardioides baculatus TaxID=2801337 RepID=A0ABS1L4M9_9ACTN|nr:hypothetical protein [Nocardioides baculatus]MBL0746626.1 hypothetical protein [Nocardioides baculatus]